MTDQPPARRGAAWLRRELERKARLARAQARDLRALYPADPEMHAAAEHFARACDKAAEAFEAALAGVVP